MRDAVHPSRIVLLGLALTAVAACSDDSPAPTALAPTDATADFTVNKAEFAIAAGAGDESSTSSATNGTKVLVGLQVRQTDGTTRVMAKLVTLTGSVLATVNTGHVGDAPYVAFDGTNFLMVWADHSNSYANGWAQMVSQAGVAVGSPFKVITENHIKDVFGLAFGGGKYLVLYRNSANALKARFVAKNKALGTTLTVNASAGDLGFQNNLATDGTNFVAVYTSSLNTAVLTRKIITSTAKLGPQLTISNSSIADAPVGIAFNAGKYMVIWSRKVSSTQSNPKAQLLTQANAKSGGVINIDGTAAYEAATNPLPHGTGFLVPYLRWNNQSSYVRMVSSVGGVGAAQQYFGVKSGKMALPIGTPVGTKIFFGVNRADMPSGGHTFDLLSSFDVDGMVLTP